jgi:hypothetical protein
MADARRISKLLRKGKRVGRPNKVVGIAASVLADPLQFISSKSGRKTRKKKKGGTPIEEAIRRMVKGK